jgi:DNA polymerase-3 subunit epsilon
MSMKLFERSGNAALEHSARQLEASPDYQVLRRVPRSHELWLSSTPTYEATKLAILDVETTGLTPGKDKMIELALVKMTLDLNGIVSDLCDPVTMLEDPGCAITPEITCLTGIIDTMVAGQVFDDHRLAAELANVDVIVAHNARFDAGFMQVRFPGLTQGWACSLQEVDWAGAGLSGRALGHLLASSGLFMDDAHRAAPDAWALGCLLSTIAPDGRAFAAELIERARRSTYRVSAVDAPFALKDLLRERGYRWNAVARVWEIDVQTIAAVTGERAALSALYSHQEPHVREIDWYNRYSG